MIDPSSPFWRERPLAIPEWELLVALADAHAVSARRDNVSTHAVAGAALGSSDYTKAMAAPLLTLGGLHAPLLRAHRFISEWDQRADPDSIRKSQQLVATIIEQGCKIPGWGQSFVKGQPDPAWKEVAAHLYGTRVGRKLDAITAALHAAGKLIFPNPGGFTAAAAMVLEMPAALAPYLFIAGRLEVWSQQFLHHSSANKLWDSPPPPPSPP